MQGQGVRSLWASILCLNTVSAIRRDPEVSVKDSSSISAEGVRLHPRLEPGWRLAPRMHKNRTSTGVTLSLYIPGMSKPKTYHG